MANPEEEDFEPDGTWYSMVAVRGDLYAVEPNHGEIVKVTPTGAISRVIDVSATQGHVVPTALTYRGNFFVGNLNLFPIVEGASNVYRVTPSGNISVWTDNAPPARGRGNLCTPSRHDSLWALEVRSTRFELRT